MFKPNDMKRLGKAVKRTEKVQKLSGDEQYRRGLARVRVKVVSSTGTGGKYSGYICIGLATDNDLTGISASTQSCLIVNEPEEGSTLSTPMIQTTPICCGDIVGTDDDSGYPIVLISCFTGYQCTGT